MSPSGTAGSPPTPVVFLAGGTGISAETLGNLIINQFPTVAFVRRKIPLNTTVEQARHVVEEPDAAMTESVTPIVFSSVAHEEVRSVLRMTRCAFIDLFGSHMDIVERVLHVNASPNVPALHGLGDICWYERRMKAIDFSLEHDDGPACATSRRPS